MISFVVVECRRVVDEMDKQSLINMRADDIARTLVNLIWDIRRDKEIPFDVRLEEELQDVEALTENIKELYKHPRKNRKILSVLNILTNSYGN